ncbi:putative major capsid protein [Yellowstone lake phycodnavirus 1]|uniref:putative major capsid protein n=1 Tax=Yellowstone lake phycodnavirus 1 TaxID=1586713 RepID=UPI0006EBA929|nr:putative major capsid protein [Yellowstone lake phycodnavirus 1]BAT22181.1 putative major capsid protein [Yellowstone lake phycodnavirus 1]
MAGRASLAFLGQDDIILVGNPEVTYFLEKYSAKIPYAKRLDRLTFDTNVLFGDEHSCQIQKRGDLVSAIYLKVNLPNTITDAVLDSIGTLMIDHVELYYGNQLIERLHGEYIEIINDVTVPQGKQRTLTGLIGKIYPQLSGPLPTPGTYTVPLPFTCLAKGLEPDNLFFKLVLNPSTEFIQSSTPYILPVDITLLVEYIYLAAPLKRGVQIYEQVQRVEYVAPSGCNHVRCNTGFVNPVKELYVVIQNTNATGYDYTTDGTTEQLVNLNLKFNGVDRIPTEIGSALYLRVLQPLEFHTRVPSRPFYMYSFSIDPETLAPSGQVNMSVIKNQTFELILNPSNSAREIRIYAVNYNFIEKGQILFPNTNDLGDFMKFA